MIRVMTFQMLGQSCQPIEFATPNIFFGFLAFFAGEIAVALLFVLKNNNGHFLLFTDFILKAKEDFFLIRNLFLIWNYQGTLFLKTMMVKLKSLSCFQPR